MDNVFLKPPSHVSEEPTYERKALAVVLKLFQKWMPQGYVFNRFQALLRTETYTESHVFYLIKKEIVSLFIVPYYISVEQFEMLFKREIGIIKDEEVWSYMYKLSHLRKGINPAAL